MIYGTLSFLADCPFILSNLGGAERLPDLEPMSGFQSHQTDLKSIMAGLGIDNSSPGICGLLVSNKPEAIWGRSGGALIDSLEVQWPGLTSGEQTTLATLLNTVVTPTRGYDWENSTVDSNSYYTSYTQAESTEASQGKPTTTRTATTRSVDSPTNEPP